MNGGKGWQAQLADIDRLFRAALADVKNGHLSQLVGYTLMLELCREAQQLPVERLLDGTATEEEIMPTDALTDASDVRDWQALAVAVHRRRTRLGLSQEAVAARGGPSGRTVRDIEQATQTRYTAKTLRDLEQALGWRFGVADDVLAGTATQEEIMPNGASTDATPDPADQCQPRRSEAVDQLDDFVTRLRGDMLSGRVGALDGYRLELEALRLRLVGEDRAREGRVDPKFITELTRIPEFD